MKVTVFGATWCAFCKTEKQWLDSKGVSYEYKNIDEDESAREYLTKVMSSQSVPVTIVESKDEKGDWDIEFVRGFDRPKLSSALGI